MHLDAADLRDFYASPLGLVVRRLLIHRIRARWRKADGETVIGLGHAVPYLGAFRGEAARLGALMPASQGALVWPPDAPSHSVLVEDEHLPLPDNSVDKLLIVHGLEAADRVRPYLREAWRVLAPEGRMLLVVPNRRGLWARFDATPFGHGRPYSRSQLERMLTEAMFTPLDWAWALQFPPFDLNVILRSAVAIERLGGRFAPRLGGLILVEAKKELMAPVGGLKAARALGGLVTVRP